MGAVIRSTSLGKNAVIASENCLTKSDLAKEDIGLLINTTVFRPDNLVEPSVAALIQKQFKLGLDYIQDGTGKSTFSFDLMNGACGVINAIQVATAFLKTNPTQSALIVCENSNEHYAQIGAAMLLTHSDTEEGFCEFGTKASLDGHPGIKAYTRLYEPDSRTNIHFEQEADYKTRLAYFMASCVKHLRTPELTLIAPAALGQKLELECIDTNLDQTDSHVAGPIVGAEKASLFLQKPYLFVAGGAGLSCAWALYR